MIYQPFVGLAVDLWNDRSLKNGPIYLFTKMGNAPKSQFYGSVLWNASQNLLLGKQ